MAENFLYYGDNLDILRRYIKDESVDLVYLDPPFNSQQNYNVLFAEHNGSRSDAQSRAFEDTWRWDQAAAEAYEDVVTHGPQRVSQVMQSFRNFLGDSDMTAYLAMMAPRMVELHRVLKPTGNLYLHCDPTASHYLKILLDSIFSPVFFRNEIIWRRTGSHNARRSFGPIHDVILFYSKSDEHKFNIVRRPYMKEHVKRRYSEGPDGRLRFSSGGNVLTGAGATEGESGEPWRGFDPKSKGRHWAIPGFYEEMMPESYRSLTSTEKLEALYQQGLVEINPESVWPVMVRYLDERDGTPLQDIWAYQPYTEETVHGTSEGIDADVAWMGPTDPERLGYPTQKPSGLLERIIRAGSDEGDVVLDPFCGCGTTVIAAQTLNRRWIGIDVTHLAVALMKHRLRDAFGEKTDYAVVGEPTDLAGAEQLAKEDPYQFQWWALGLVGARPVEQKRGADKGIDGRLFFHDEGPSGKTKQVIFSVKSGNVTVSQVRDLRGVVEREKAALGVLLSLNEPTQPMRAEAAGAGFYESPGWNKRYPRIQLVTIKELLEGNSPEMPPVRQVGLTFKRAPKMKQKAKGRQTSLDE